MEKLKELVSKCKASVEITINDHKDVYESVHDFIPNEEREGISDDTFAKMVELDTIVRVQFYPSTPIGFYVIYHYDIDMAMDLALGCN
jgi:hypothetical protein